MGESNLNPSLISGQLNKEPVPLIAPILFGNKNPNKNLLDLINQKIERYNTLIQGTHEKDRTRALLLLQEIEYAAHFLMNHPNLDLSVPGRKWYLTSGIPQQFLRFEKPSSQDLTAQDYFYALANKSSPDSAAPEFGKLFKEAKSAGVNETAVDALKKKFSSVPYQHSDETIRNYAILRQLQKTILYTLMTNNEENPKDLQALLLRVNGHLHALIQSDPTLQQQYSRYHQYSRDIDTFYSPKNSENILSFMKALTRVETHLLNASDDTIIEFYKNNPGYGIVAYKDAEIEDFNHQGAAATGIRMSIERLKADWVKNGAKTIEELTVLAPSLMENNYIKFLAAGNNITWRLENKETGAYLILRAAKQKLTNLEHIDTLKDTPAGTYFAEEYATLVRAVDEGQDYTLSIIEYCPQGNLQHIRKTLSNEDTALIQKQACGLLFHFTDFCAKLIDENAYLTDIKLSNFLYNKISDLKSVRCCAPGTELHHLNRNDVTGDITTWYAPPEWDVIYTVIECSALPEPHTQKPGEIYYDTTTHEYRVLGHDSKMYEGKSAELGDKKTRATAIRAIERNIPFDMDKFMSYQLGLALYDFLTGLTITLEGESSTERNEAREKALTQLQTFKATGIFDYSAPVFKGVEGQALQALCVAMLKSNPEERISVKEAAAKLNALKINGFQAESWQNSRETAYIKARDLLIDAMQSYQEHNEAFHTDSEFPQKYQLLQTFLQEMTEAKHISQDVGFFAHAVENQAIELKTWIQHAKEHPQEQSHFYPHYCKSVLNSGFKGHLQICDHKLHELSASIATENEPADEKKKLIEKITNIHHTLNTTMTNFLSFHHNNITTTPTIEFAKVFEAASALELYVSTLQTHFSDLKPKDFQQMHTDLSQLTSSMPTENLTEALKKETLYLQYRILSEQEDREQAEPMYLRELRKALVFHFLDKNLQKTDNLSQDLHQYLAHTLAHDLITHAEQYQQRIAQGKYKEAYHDALELNKQILGVYTKLMGDTVEDDPLLEQMARLREEMNTAHNTGAVNSKSSAEILQKVNLELINSISYMAGPKLSKFKPVHSNDEWAQLRKDSEDVSSPTKKWAKRILLGVGVAFAFVLVTGTGGVAALPSVTAQIAAAVSPSVANSAINSISLSTIVNRAKVIFSDKKKIQHSDSVFNTTSAVQKSLESKVAEKKINDNLHHAPVLAPNQNSLFHHHDHLKPKEEPKDSEGEGDTGNHIRPKE